MDIAEVAKRSGVAASALRYYERRGLIQSLPNEGPRRKFQPSVLERLALIALGQAAGFSLDEIATMFAPNGEPKIDRSMLSAKANDIDRTIKGLMAMSDGLRHAAACPASNHTACPSFQRLLKAAADGILKTHQGPCVPRATSSPSGEPRTSNPKRRQAQSRRPEPAQAPTETLFSQWAQFDRKTKTQP